MQGMMQREVVMHQAAGLQQGNADRSNRARARNQKAATNTLVKLSSHAKGPFQSSQIEAKGAILIWLKLLIL